MRAYWGSDSRLYLRRENIYIVKTLREFVYVTDEGRDEGANGKSLAPHETVTSSQSRAISPTKGQRDHFATHGRCKNTRPAPDEVKHAGSNVWST